MNGWSVWAAVVRGRDGEQAMMEQSDALDSKAGAALHLAAPEPHHSRCRSGSGQSGGSGRPVIATHLPRTHSNLAISGPLVANIKELVVPQCVSLPGRWRDDSVLVGQRYRERSDQAAHQWCRRQRTCLGDQCGRSSQWELSTQWAGRRRRGQRSVVWSTAQPRRGELTVSREERGLGVSSSAGCRRQAHSTAIAPSARHQKCDGHQLAHPSRIAGD